MVGELSEVVVGGIVVCVMGFHHTKNVRIMAGASEAGPNCMRFAVAVKEANSQ